MKKLFSIKAMLVVGALALPFGATAGTVNLDPVLDARGNNVHDFRGNCVRTHWQADEDYCGQGVVTQFNEADRTVYFGFDKSTLTPRAKAKLDTIAAYVGEQSTVLHADIVGHADRIGNASYNVRLSQRRAQTVKNYLAARGFVNTRVADIEAVGESAPLTDGCYNKGKLKNTIECLAPDRRVEVRLRTASGVSYERDVPVHGQFLPSRQLPYRQ